jgi:hypothetical protein
MSRVLLWAAFIFATAVLVYGVVSTNLLASETWSSVGITRFARYSRAFLLAYAAIAILLRKYIAIAVAIPVMVFTVAGTGAIPVLSVVLLAISSAVLGRWLFRVSDWGLSFLGGLCVWSLAISVLAHVKVHYAAVHLAVHVAILVARRKETLLLVTDARNAFRPRHIPWSVALAVGAFLYAFLAHWLLVWKPEASGDGMAMHLPIALDFANNHAFTFDFRQYIWALAPIGADFCYAAVAVLGGEYAARLLNVLMFGVVSYLLFRASRRWLPPAIACFVAALLASSPMVQLVTANMFVENFTAALSIAALIALWQYHDTGEVRTFWLCAFLLGSNAGWKLGGVAVALGFLPFVIIAARRHARSALTAMAAVLFLVPAAFPYVKAYVLSGNPVYPFNNALFQSPLIKETLYDIRYHEPLTWRTLYDLTFYTERYYEGQHGSFGLQYLFLILIALVAIWKMRGFAERTAVVSALLAAFCIAATQPNARYFYPVLPIILVGGAAALSMARTQSVRLFRACIVILSFTYALNLWLLPTSGWYHRDFYLRPFFGETGRLEYLRSTAPAREVTPYLNTTTGGVLFIQGFEIPGLRRPFFSDHWHNWPMRKAIELARNAAQFYDIARQAGIEHFVRRKKPTPDEVSNSPAAYQFLGVCGETEFETPDYVVMRIARECEARFQDLAKQSKVFGPGKYNDDDPRVIYGGFWNPGRGEFPDSFGATVSYSDDKGAHIQISLEGSAFTYGFTRAQNRGKARIYIDGKPAGDFDQYGPNTEWQQTKRYLLSSAGPHSVRIEVLQQKSPAATGAFVDFDFFIVEP